MDTGKIRIKDIAERAGVSVGTVDRVLHERPNVSPKALEKVKKALEEMDYKPNMYASALAYNKSYTFYSLIPKHESEAYWEEDYRALTTGHHHQVHRHHARAQHSLYPARLLHARPQAHWHSSDKTLLPVATSQHAC